MAEVSLVNSPLDECHSTLLMISQHWFRQWLVAVRQQAITWANGDRDLLSPQGIARPNWVKRKEHLLKLKYLVYQLLLQQFYPGQQYFSWAGPGCLKHIIQSQIFCLFVMNNFKYVHSRFCRYFCQGSRAQDPQGTCNVWNFKGPKQTLVPPQKYITYSPMLWLHSTLKESFRRAPLSKPLMVRLPKHLYESLGLNELNEHYPHCISSQSQIKLIFFLLISSCLWTPRVWKFCCSQEISCFPGQFNP